MEPALTIPQYSGPDLSTFLTTSLNGNDFDGVIEYAPKSTTPDSIKVNLVTTISLISLTDVNVITDTFEFTLEKLSCTPILSLEKPPVDFQVEYVYRDPDVILDLEDFSVLNTNFSNFMI